MATRTIKVGALARVEGEGGLKVVIRNGAVTRAELNIFEPPRFFEAMLRGRAFTEVPDIVARICGICPVAYQMSAVHALEAALGAAGRPATVPQPSAYRERSRASASTLWYRGSASSRLPSTRCSCASALVAAASSRGSPRLCADSTASSR